MSFKRLVATVNTTEETLVLYDGKEFQNFDRLHEILGKSYEGVNDDLMEGIVDGCTEWSHTVYKDGEPVLTITFTFTPEEA